MFNPLKGRSRYDNAVQREHWADAEMNRKNKETPPSRYPGGFWLPILLVFGIAALVILGIWLTR